MNKEFIAEKLRVLMSEKSITPMELSEITGINRSTIEGYIKAKSLLKLDSLVLICEKLQVSADIFLGLKEKKISPPQLSEDETEILKIYKQLDKRGQAKMITVGYDEIDRAKQEQAAATAVNQSAG